MQHQMWQENVCLPLRDLQKPQQATSCLPCRRGKGKMRNRRYVNRKGPLVVYGKDDGIAAAFRNLPGVDTASVTALNLLQVSSCSHFTSEAAWSAD